MNANETIQSTRRSGRNMKFQEVTNNPDFAPAPCWLFPDSLFTTAKKVFARALRHSSTFAKQISVRNLAEQMVCGCIPSYKPGAECNAITCLAYVVTRSGQKRTVSLFDAPGTSYVYVAVNGSLCLAHFDDDAPGPRYFAID